MASSSTPKESLRKNQKSQTLEKHIVAEATLKPHERRSMLLGNFSTENSPVGFTIEVTPNLIDMVVARVSILEATVGQRFVSYVTNNADKPVSVKIFQI